MNFITGSEIRTLSFLIFLGSSMLDRSKVSSFTIIGNSLFGFQLLSFLRLLGVFGFENEVMSFLNTLGVGVAGSEYRFGSQLWHYLADFLNKS